MPANLAEWKMQYRMVFGREPTYADLVQEVTMNGTHHLMNEYQAQQAAASAPPLPPPKPLLQQAQELENSGQWREAANLRYQQQAIHNQVVVAQAIPQMNIQAALAAGNTAEAARQEQILKEMEVSVRTGTAEQIIQKPEVVQAVSQMNQYQAEAEEAGKQRKYEEHKARKYGLFGPSWKSNGEKRKETMLEQGTRHHPIVEVVVSSVVVPAVGMVVGGPVGAVAAGATYGAVEHGAEGIAAGAIKGAIYAALAPTAGETLGVNPEGFGGTITGLNAPSLLNQLGVASAPAVGGGIGLFGNLGQAGLAEQILAPAVQIASSTTAPVMAASTTTTAALPINLALTAAEAVSSVAPVIGYSYANQLTESRTAISALQSEQRKKRRREFYRSIIGMGFGAFVASISAPFLLAGQSSFVIALGEGAIFGGIASGISRRNAAQGAFEGAFFAGLGNIIDTGLSHSEYLSEAKRLREALGAAASSTVYIVVHDGKLEDVLIGAGSSALSNFLVPSVTGSVNEEILRVFVTGIVTSLTHRTELAQSLVAAGLGSVQSRIQRLARQYGNDIVMGANNRTERREITKRTQVRSKTKTHSPSLSKSLEIAVAEAERVLGLYDVNLPREKLIAMLKAHPDLRVSPNSIEDSLMRIGRLDNSRIGGHGSNEQALIKGVQKFLYYNFHTFAKEVRSGSSFVNTEKAQSNKATSHSAKKDEAWRFDALEFATQKASEMLTHKGIEVPNGRVRRAFEREALLQGSREQVQQNLIALGKADGPVKNNKSAFERGREKVFLVVLNRLARETQAEELNTVGKIGRTSIKTLGAVGKRVKTFADEHPELVSVSGKLIEASTITERYAMSTVGRLIGKGQKLAINSNNIGKAFEEVQRDLVNYYNRKCVELNISVDEQAGIATLGALILSTSKSGRKLERLTSFKNIQVAGSTPAASLNAQVALHKKMRSLQKAQKIAVKIEELTDGRIRYYEKETFSIKPGLTRGASHVTEYNPLTGQVRSWHECYDQLGNVNRVHPKMIDGQDMIGQHYPPTGKEIKLFTSKPKGEM